jgi:hypothetical protein
VANGTIEVPRELKVAERAVKGNDYSALFDEFYRELHGKNAAQRTPNEQANIRLDLSKFLLPRGFPEHFAVVDVQLFGKEKVIVGTDGSKFDHLGRLVDGANRRQASGEHLILESPAAKLKYKYYQDNALREATWTDKGTGVQYRIAPKLNEKGKWQVSIVDDQSGSTQELAGPPNLNQATGVLTIERDNGERIVATAEGGRFKINDRGQLESVVYPNGDMRLFHYDGNRPSSVDFTKAGKKQRGPVLPWSVNPETGTYTEFESDTVKTVYGPDGSSVRMTKDGHIWKDREGHVRETDLGKAFDYDEAGLKSATWHSLKDGRRQTISFYRDQLGRWFLNGELASFTKDGRPSVDKDGNFTYQLMHDGHPLNRFTYKPDGSGIVMAPDGTKLVAVNKDKSRVMFSYENGTPLSVIFYAKPENEQQGKLEPVHYFAYKPRLDVWINFGDRIVVKDIKANKQTGDYTITDIYGKKTTIHTNETYTSAELIRIFKGDKEIKLSERGGNVH